MPRARSYFSHHRCPGGWDRLLLTSTSGRTSTGDSGTPGPVRPVGPPVDRCRSTWTSPRVNGHWPHARGLRLPGASASFLRGLGIPHSQWPRLLVQSSHAPDAVDFATSVKKEVGTVVGLGSRRFRDFLTDRGIFCSDVGLVIRRFQGHLDKSSRRWTSALRSGTSVARGIDVVIEVWGFIILSCRGCWFSSPVDSASAMKRDVRH